ncbi:MAG: glucokinase [gamma proteobacterium symbiont of Bathyaustriella thionipta]|nr:glucokinase [gamma proteobacterium symbiont of Bathyaustriella thionipta]MCU7949465.1 glucokinase [gamma proteobacterium symbiont of Bathyaustriella thionipta]MCU7953116.1 glucokinase [gamma proteobacterium symbiont of Bathyaustriella thionipta]MCU7956052.1 glucokinase [gamma proteobacterium symbiont of Bathyaustriella thionipta]MCU7966966.1 glucokinase [gamma proteobacterium symbiont of Bathyaustriella thionipta]
MNVLAGDIGGTKTNLGIFNVNAQQVSSLFEATYVSVNYQSLEEIVAHFLSQVSKTSLAIPVTTACFGVAGPVKNNHCEVTNLPWIIDASLIQKKFDWQCVNLLNDLEANAWGITALDDHDFITLNKGDLTAGQKSTGQINSGNASIIAAGTGLGEAGLFWDGRKHTPFASEGGHCDFSPGTETEYRLHQFLSIKYHGHVSWERIVSGMGLENLYQFLCYEAQSQPPAWLQQQMQTGDSAAAISNAALSGKDQLCRQALNWFVHLYGVEAGNHALKIMSSGGVFLGGGIAPKIITQLQSGAFMQAFCNKGRMQPLLEAMPVKVIMNDKTALYGPALYAVNRLQLNTAQETA